MDKDNNRGGRDSGGTAISPIQALQRQRRLLELEYNADKEEFMRHAEAVGIMRRVKRGDAWWPVRIGRSYYNSLNQLVVEVTRTGDTDIEHNFEFGRPVSFFRMEDRNENAGAEESGRPHDGIPFAGGNHVSSLSSRTSSPVLLNPKQRACVSYVDGDRMVVAVPDGFSMADLHSSENLGVQLSFDETSYRLMFDALDRTMTAKGRTAYLRDLFYSRQKAGRFTFQPMHFDYLNAMQEEAVNEVLRAKDVAVVHGPPGTGKTTTLVEAIYETLRRESQVLVCAQSNMAVDWICEKLVDRGVNVLRIGNPTKVNDKMLSFTYERRFEAHPDYPQLWSIRKAIRDLRSNRRRGDGRLHQKLESLKGRATEIEIRINAELFGEARVIASTLTGSANRLLDGMKFGTLFIDEAAQALEAACWIAIRRASRVIFAGDHCQLPPTVKCIEAVRGGLAKTLMERIVEQKPEAVTLLRMQYRMNEEIMRFSSDWFYGGMVEAAPGVKCRGILDLDIPMEWVDTSENVENTVDGEDSACQANENRACLQVGSVMESEPSPTPSCPSPFREEFVGESFGRINKGEAELTLRTLEAYFMRIGRQRILDERLDVGIISPYRAQVQYLRRLLMKREFFKPFRRYISVNTVDGFQGQERDIILISLVRANSDGDIGFLRDLRRMNVAITRARMKLIILGDASTMTRHAFYRHLYRYVRSLKNHHPI